MVPATCGDGMDGQSPPQPCALNANGTDCKFTSGSCVFVAAHSIEFKPHRYPLTKAPTAAPTPSPVEMTSNATCCGTDANGATCRLNSAVSATCGDGMDANGNDCTVNEAGTACRVTSGECSFVSAIAAGVSCASDDAGCQYTAANPNGTNPVCNAPSSTTGMSTDNTANAASNDVQPQSAHVTTSVSVEDTSSVDAVTPVVDSEDHVPQPLAIRVSDLSLPKGWPTNPNPAAKKSFAARAREEAIKHDDERETESAGTHDRHPEVQNRKHAVAATAAMLRKAAAKVGNKNSVSAATEAKDGDKEAVQAASAAAKLAAAGKAAMKAAEKAKADAAAAAAAVTSPLDKAKEAPKSLLHLWNPVGGNELGASAPSIKDNYMGYESLRDLSAVKEQELEGTSEVKELTDAYAT